MLGSVRLVICMHASYKFPQKFPCCHLIEIRFCLPAFAKTVQW